MPPKTHRMIVEITDRSGSDPATLMRLVVKEFLEDGIHMFENGGGGDNIYTDVRVKPMPRGK